MNKYLILLLFCTTSVLANGSTHHNNIIIVPAPTVETSTVDSTTTTSTYIVDNSREIDALDNKLNIIASMGVATSVLAEISHDGKSHKHNNASVALGVYGDKTAIAIGISKMHDDQSYKSSLTFGEGGEISFGVSGGYNW